MIIIDELFRRIRFYLTFFTKKSNKNDIIILELQTLLKNHIANTEGNIKRCLDNQEYILYELKKINRYKDLKNEVWQIIFRILLFCIHLPLLFFSQFIRFIYFKHITLVSIFNSFIYFVT